MKDIIETIAKERGVPDVTVRKWRSRGFVPHKHRLPMILAAQKRGKRLNPGDFDFGRCAGGEQPKKRKAA